MTSTDPITPRAEQTLGTDQAHCPHCTAPLCAPLGPQGGRCPDCRLFIAADRVVDARDAAQRRVRRDRA